MVLSNILITFMECFYEMFGSPDRPTQKRISYSFPYKGDLIDRYGVIDKAVYIDVENRPIGG